MEKIKKIRITGNPIEINSCGDGISALYEIEQILSYIENFRIQGATHVAFEVSSAWDGGQSDVSMQGAKIEEESDNEYAIRMELIARQENREREQYLRLKAKFEDNN